MSDQFWVMLRRFGVVVAILCAAGASYVPMLQAIYGERFAHDFAVFWRVANTPVETAYLPNAKPFPYAPTGLLWVKPLALVSEMTGYVLMSIASVVSLFLVCRRLGKAAILLTFIAHPTVRCIRNGQISAVLTAAVIWAYGTTNRIAGGAAIGAVATIKPQFVALAPLMMVMDRDRKAFWSAAITFIAICLLSLVFGPERWAEWVGSFPHFRKVLIDAEVLAIAINPAGIAEFHGLNPLPFLLLGIGLGIGVVYLCRNGDVLEKATAVMAGSLLASPYALLYDLVAVMPFTALMVVRGRIWYFPAMAGWFSPLPLLLIGIDRLGRRQMAKWRQALSFRSMTTPSDSPSPSASSR